MMAIVPAGIRTEQIPNTIQGPTARAACILEESYQRFKEPWCLYLQGRRMSAYPLWIEYFHLTADGIIFYTEDGGSRYLRNFINFLSLHWVTCPVGRSSIHLFRNKRPFHRKFSNFLPATFAMKMKAAHVHPDDGFIRLLRNVNNFLPDYMLSSQHSFYLNIVILYCHVIKGDWTDLGLVIGFDSKTSLANWNSKMHTLTDVKCISSVLDFMTLCSHLVQCVIQVPPTALVVCFCWIHTTVVSRVLSKGIDDQGSIPGRGYRMLVHNVSIPIRFPGHRMYPGGIVYLQSTLRSASAYFHVPYTPPCLFLWKVNKCSR